MFGRVLDSPFHRNAGANRWGREALAAAWLGRTGWGISIISVAGTAGLSAAYQPRDTAAAVGIAASFSAVALVGRSGLSAAVLLATAATALVSPLAAFAVLLVGLLAAGFACHLGAHPVTMLGIPLSAYVLLGAANISSYRGQIASSTVMLELAHVLVLLIVALLAGGGAGRLARRNGVPVSSTLVWLSAVPGLIGAALVIHRSGDVFLHPASRFGSGGLANLLLESLTATLGLYAYSVFSARRATKFDVVVFATLCVLLTASGYRGWLLIGGAIVVAIAVYLGRLRLSRKVLVVLVVVGIAVISGFSAIRRATDQSQISSKAAAVRYDATDIPGPLRPVHFAFRESIALTRDLVEWRNAGHRMTSSLLLADFRTMLPGKQQDGGQMVGSVVGAAGGGGLTPGLVGAAYTDLGYGSLVLFAALGAVVGLLWRKARTVPYMGVVYLMAVAYSLHWFHRGIPKPTYVIVPLIFFLVARVAHARAAIASS